MELNWLQSLVFGLVSGLTDLLPLSSQAHQTILLKFFGQTGGIPVTRLVIHLASALTILVCMRGRLGQIRRQLRLLRMPKRRRNRPVDVSVLMDLRILRTALVPMLAMLLLYGVTRRWNGLLVLAGLSLCNAAVLYLPSLLPTADKDSRLVTPMESLYMGLGAGAGILPGVSSMGVGYSVGILHGIDKKYILHLAIFMHLVISAGRIFYDVLDLISTGVAAPGVWEILGWAAAGAAAVAGTVMAMRMLDRVGPRKDLTGFAFYSFGMALLAFILYLVV